MADGVAEEKDGGDDDGGGFEAQIAPERQTGGHANREVGHADLELEGADLPSNVSGGDFGKDNMGYARPKPRDSDREQQEPGQEALGGGREKGGDGEKGRQILKNKTNALADRNQP
ncbi:hypothetical protein K9U39_09005 [Rhodoblastus acidophilus]|uniref:Uncharacterized protein n=1 Tax=Candidatus Rhodoblastus alkanivorans TaxID=2954117 RepID=A0ABS9Z8R4_9HYPH|nr:hypothetical protein [Candidatus Rhodoblastus alkanivorans]MCI4678982.1 hypothetical protein [Candidatus Rhodoblastus alkanivorans]MCI4683760.1 hypothetical protein [Candidatus Rhodoblastus alkanivorans]MDI4641078.1 hypothetical protein [Rhodoblastus acidophilus]